MPESLTPVVVSLPVTDRRTSSAFYRAFLGQEPPGEPADDGEPEPLEFHVNDGLRLMLVPSGGFGWVLGEDHEVAPRGQVEMLLSRTASSEAAVAKLVAVAAGSGGAVVTPPGAQPWGYAAVVADPDGHLWQVICT